MRNNFLSSPSSMKGQTQSTHRSQPNTAHQNEQMKSHPELLHGAPNLSNQQQNQSQTSINPLQNKQIAKRKLTLTQRTVNQGQAQMQHAASSPQH